jgi:hypothetical protein
VINNKAGRCARCKTALWSEYAGIAALRFVRVAALDDPAALPPIMTQGSSGLKQGSHDAA